jgi:hypothetical protein
MSPRRPHASASNTRAGSSLDQYRVQVGDDEVLFEIRPPQTEAEARYIRTNGYLPEVARRIAEPLWLKPEAVLRILESYQNGYVNWHESPAMANIGARFPSVLADVVYEQGGIKGLTDLLQAPTGEVRLASMVRMAELHVPT